MNFCLYLERRQKTKAFDPKKKTMSCHYYLFLLKSIIMYSSQLQDKYYLFFFFLCFQNIKFYLSKAFLSGLYTPSQRSLRTKTSSITRKNRKIISGFSQICLPFKTCAGNSFGHRKSHTHTTCTGKLKIKGHEIFDLCFFLTASPVSFIIGLRLGQLSKIRRSI